MNKYLIGIITTILAIAQIQATGIIPEDLAYSPLQEMTQSDASASSLLFNSYLEIGQGHEQLLSINHTTGDVDGNGDISIADVSALIDILLGDIADYDTRIRCDMNFDGNISISDLSLLIDYLLTR